MTEARKRLDQPKLERRTLRPRFDPEAFGQWTERVARFLGTGRYLIIQTFLIILWVIWNVTFRNGPLHFDKYPFIFLTLILSLQAAYSAPLILLAQNRQAERDRLRAEDDRLVNQRTVAEAEFLARELAASRLSLGKIEATLARVEERLERFEDGMAEDEAPTAGTRGGD